ncbi:IS4 family transposase [Mucilaginibacter flavus]|uniref:IS4 family transposase n=1 Tax=Mucilaginibacter flavus TaxID=931504 RepID=UPI0025B4B330|nr:IS4 family transposase [Mucilaginibacter flavus]MDN3583802.1 IS4 family transposase [Mucilaginibacter flavus]
MTTENLDKVTVKQLLTFIPDQSLSALAAKTGVDYQAKVLFGRSMFYLLLYGLAENERTSLRSLEDTFNSRRFKLLFNLDSGQTTRYNSISDRLATMNLDFFEESYKMIYGLFHEHFKPKETLKYNITRVDSTMVAETASKLEKGMITGIKKDGRKQIKYTISLDGLLPSSVKVFTEQAELSEDKTIPKTILALVDTHNDNVFVFDRGVQNRGAYVDLDEKKLRFVTRVRTNSRSKVIEELLLPVNRKVGNLTILKDEWVYLYGSKNKRVDVPFRLITTKDEEDKLILFVTNMKQDADKELIPVKDIITIYKQRWDIEVFFRFIKQELNFSHFLSTNLNGIKIILYMTLILAMLIHIYKKYNNVGYKTAKRRVKMELEELLTIIIVKACGGNPDIVFR